MRAAGASHALLYLLMLLLPLSGWVMASAAPTQDLLGIQNMVFGLFALPDPWVPGVERIEVAAKAGHLAAAILLALLLAVHVAAALKHDLIDRDDVLARMSWGRSVRAPVSRVKNHVISLIIPASRCTEHGRTAAGGRRGQGWATCPLGLSD